MPMCLCLHGDGDVCLFSAGTLVSKHMGREEGETRAPPELGQAVRPVLQHDPETGRNRPLVVEQ